MHLDNSDQVGCRLQQFYLNWQLLKDPFVSHIIEQGYEIPFHTLPPLSIDPPSHLLQENSQLAVLKLEVVKLLQMQVIAPITDHRPRFWSLLFYVTRPSDPKPRPILDLSRLNRYVQKMTFKMETVSSVASLLVEECWGATLDLRRAYWHVQIHPNSLHLLSFQLDGNRYQFLALPMGLTTAPWVFNRICRPIVRYLREKCIQIHIYLDDWMLFHKSQFQCAKAMIFTLWLLQHLGFQISPKSHLLPSQTLQWLGVHWNLQSLQLALPVEKQLSIVQFAQKLLSHSHVTRRDLEKFAGLGNFAACYIPAGRMYLYPIISWFLRHSDPLTRDVPILLDSYVRQHLLWWTKFSNLNKPVPMRVEAPSLILTTDASLQGWGASLTMGDQLLTNSGLWTPQEQQIHINVFEMKALYVSLLTWTNLLQGNHLTFMSDNTTVLWYLHRQGGTKSLHMLQETFQVLHLCLLKGIHLHPIYIATHLNTLTDALSRTSPVKSEWSLNPVIFQKIYARFPLLQVGLFAIRYNTQLKKFVSPFPDPLAVGTDALAISWSQWSHLYAFPPLPILQRVLSKWSKEGRGELILVAPLWPSAPWYPFLMSLALSKPHPLPVGKDLLIQVVQNQRLCHPTPQFFRLHVWVL